MIRILLPLICAALGFAAASCSQSEEPPAPAAETPAPPQQTSHAAASAAMSTPADPKPVDQAASDQEPPDQSVTDANPDAPASARVESRASTLIGMPVASADGGSLGEVKDIIFDRQGRATHVVIAYGTASPTPDGKLTAMPWDAAMATIKDGRLVLDDAQLQGAPSFTQDTWPNLDDPAWSATTDAYWRKAVQAAIAAHPGAPVDSTSRQRERPPRDGN